VFSGERPTIEEIDETFDNDVQDMRISSAGRHPCDDKGNVDWDHLRKHRTSSEYDIKRWDDYGDFEDPGRKHGEVDRSRPEKIYLKRGDNSEYVIDSEDKYPNRGIRIKREKKVPIYLVEMTVRYNNSDGPDYYSEVFTEKQPTIEEITERMAGVLVEDMCISYAGRLVERDIDLDTRGNPRPEIERYIKYWDDETKNGGSGYHVRDGDNYVEDKSIPKRVYHKRGDKSKYIYDRRVGQSKATCPQPRNPDEYSIPKDDSDDKVP